MDNIPNMDRSNPFDDLYEASRLDSNPLTSSLSEHNAYLEGVRNGIRIETLENSNTKNSIDNKGMENSIQPSTESFAPPDLLFSSPIPTQDWTQDFIHISENSSSYDWNQHIQQNVYHTRDSRSPVISAHQSELGRLNKKYSINVLNLDVGAHSYVQQRDELIIPRDNSSISSAVELRLAYFLGYVSGNRYPSLPRTIYNFFLRINCVYPFQIMNKLGGNRITLAYCIAQSNPSILFQQHFEDLWVLFSYARECFLSFH